MGPDGPEIDPSKSRPEGSPFPPEGPEPAWSTTNVRVLSPATNVPLPGSPTLNTLRQLMRVVPQGLSEPPPCGTSSVPLSQTLDVSSAKTPIDPVKPANPE